MTRALLTRRQIAAVCAGNGLDFYDFLTFSFFATQIGRTLFPDGGGDGLLYALATFGAGFLTRPLGALVIGRMADTRGRKRAMLLSFALMGLSVAGLALTPSYAAIGMAAPLLAVGFRMLQGFALGGEVGPNTAYLLEVAPPHRRGFYVSLQYATQSSAILIAGLVGWSLAAMLDSAELDAFGWRIAMLIGTSIVPLAWAIRRTLPETLDAAAPDEPARASLRALAPVAIGGFLLMLASTVGTYTLAYLTTYAQGTLGMEVRTAFTATIAVGIGGVAADLCGGWLVDRFGRKRVLVVPWLLLTPSAVPVFMAVGELRSGAVLFWTSTLLALLVEFAAIPSLVLLTEALPRRVRAGSLSIIYAAAVSIFGGSTQIVENRLIAWTGDPLAPGWYMTGAMVVGLLGVLLIRERRDA